MSWSQYTTLGGSDCSIGWIICLCLWVGPRAACQAQHDSGFSTQLLPPSPNLSAPLSPQKGPLCSGPPLVTSTQSTSLPLARACQITRDCDVSNNHHWSSCIYLRRDRKWSLPPSIPNPSSNTRLLLLLTFDTRCDFNKANWLIDWFCWLLRTLCLGCHHLNRCIIWLIYHQSDRREWVGLFHSQLIHKSYHENMIEGLTILYGIDHTTDIIVFVVNWSSRNAVILLMKQNDSICIYSLKAGGIKQIPCRNVKKEYQVRFSQQHQNTRRRFFPIYYMYTMVFRSIDIVFIQDMLF